MQHPLLISFSRNLSLPPPTNALPKHFILLHTDLELWISRDTNDSFFDSRQNLSWSEEITNVDKTHC